MGGKRRAVRSDQGEEGRDKGIMRMRLCLESHGGDRDCGTARIMQWD